MQHYFFYHLTISILTDPEGKMDEIEEKQKYGSIQHILITNK